MKYPLNISLQIIESYHREISTQSLQKSYYYGQKFIILNLSENKVLKMKF